MIPRFKLTTEADNQIALDAIKVRVNLVVTNGVLDIPFNWSQEGFRTTFDIRFTNAQKLNSFWTAFNLNKLTLMAGATGYKAARHLCSHDDPEVFNCKDDPRAEYEEINV